MSEPTPTCLNCGGHMVAQTGGYFCAGCGATSGTATPDPHGELKRLLESLRVTASRMFTDQATQADYTLWDSGPGYEGRRSGWYPLRPKRTRRRRHAS